MGFSAIVVSVILVMFVVIALIDINDSIKKLTIELRNVNSNFKRRTHAITEVADAIVEGLKHDD